MRRLCAFIAVGIFGSATVVSATAGDHHVAARLVADRDRIAADDRFYLGVELTPEPGWHVYWRHPGEAGLATELRVELPAGWRIGEVQWPTPMAFEQPGGIAGYGYEEPVLLAAEVAAPTAFTAPVPVTVTAAWLACKDVCVLGDAVLSAELPLDDAEPELFDAWRKQLPRPADPARLTLSTTGGPVAGSGATELSLWLRVAGDPAAVELFPIPGPSLKIDNVVTRSRGGLTRVDLRVTRVAGGGEAVTAFEAVVAITDRVGVRIGRTVSIDLE